MSMPAEHIPTSIMLADLLQGLADAPAVPIKGIASDSRQLAEGDLFLACRGITSHGIDFVEQAIEAGVAAIAYDASTTDASHIVVDVPLVGVTQLAEHLGAIANRFYDQPSAAVQTIGVTGTNGKTTVAWLVAQCLERLGKRCGYIGTLGHGIGEVAGGAGLTTPGVVELHGELAEFRDAGAQFAALEVSSHALAQKRVDGVAFDTVMFTNLSRDHLDYHGDMRSYAESKALLFTAYPATHRIVNLDSEFGAELAARCGQDVITVSTNFDRVANGRPYVFVRAVVANAGGSQIRVSTSWGDGTIELPLPGDFNVANAAIVLAFLLAQGTSIESACTVLGEVEAPPGRMQRVAGPVAAPTVYVDYAHTPDALSGALGALRGHCKGKLWCVFGCGGERDAGKRPQMGRVAERRADRLILTNDNPRGESPAGIISEIIAGVARADRATVIEDRATAIAWAIREAGPQDTILIAGKGHENYQLIGGERRDFADYGAAAVALAARQEQQS